MSKAFTKESDGEEDEHEQAAEEAAHAPLGVKNHITPSGLQRLRDELRFLLARERPAVTQVVPGRRATAIAVRTPIISTANGGCARSIDGFAF
jgi:hypothetical protein